MRMRAPGAGRLALQTATALMATSWSAAAPPPPTGPKVILTVVIDDMGWHDAQPHNPQSPTPTLGALAAEGILLERFYTYVFCSPTRRS